MRRSQITLALGAIGLSLAAAGCGSSSPSSASNGSAHSSAATPAATVTSAAASPVSTATPASQTSSPVQSAAPALAGVVADCTSAPHGLSVRPGSITLACADNGSGVEGMTWTSWSASAAAGHGTFWDKLCTPSCADGKIGSYPVTVALSVVKTSPQGPWLSRLAVTWDAARPPGTVPGSYGLLAPGT